jgi:hypothetical protein
LPRLHLELGLLLLLSLLLLPLLLLLLLLLQLLQLPLGVELPLLLLLLLLLQLLQLPLGVELAIRRPLATGELCLGLLAPLCIEVCEGGDLPRVLGLLPLPPTLRAKASTSARDKPSRWNSCPNVSSELLVDL